MLSIAGKKNKRPHIRVSDDLHRIVVARAELDERKVQDQYRVFIVRGMNCTCHVQNSEFRRTLSPDVEMDILPASPKVAESRRASQKRSA